MTVRALAAEGYPEKLQSAAPGEGPRSVAGAGKGLLDLFGVSGVSPAQDPSDDHEKQAQKDDGEGDVLDGAGAQPIQHD